MNAPVVGTFYFRLPFCVARNRNLLLVEDSDNDAFIFRRSVSQTGLPIHLIHARDGREAIQVLQNAPPFDDTGEYPLPDLILTDLKMPRYDGFYLLEWLQKHSEFDGIPIVVLSSSCLAEDIEAAYNLGAAAFVSKPASNEALTRALQAMLKFMKICELPVTPVTSNDDSVAEGA